MEVYESPVVLISPNPQVEIVSLSSSLDRVGSMVLGLFPQKSFGGYC